MVYSRSASTRAYIKAVALCALSLSLAALPLSSAQEDTTTAACEVSDGDKSFGVRVVDDAGCANGGLGCYNDHCRYCKMLDTPKSTQFESCSSFGANFPTMATLTVTTGPCTISEGDAAVGIAAIVDAECLYGGLGCFSDHCRFCKVKETPESTAFLGCTDFNATTIVTDGTTTTPAPTAVVTDATTTHATTTDASCSLEVSEGDAAVGINIVTDASCASGGAGCIDDVCRFCRATTTIQSAAFTDCSSIAGATVTDTHTEAPTASPTETPTEAPTELPTEAPATGSTCDQVAADGDIKAGITIVMDTSCATGGIGCISDVCRYCRLVYTQQSAAFTDCGTILGTAATEAPTEAPTAAPTQTTTSTTVDTEAPTGAPTDAPTDQPVCTQVASSGDASVGINVVTDATCASGGVGCIDDVCRFCKVLATTQSMAFVDCTSVAGYSTGAVTTATNAPIDSPTDAPTLTDAPTDAPTVTNAPTEAPTNSPSETPAVTIAPLTSGVACTQVASEGDAGVGINIFTDASCASGGVGCIDDVCRFCKVTSTEQSAAFVDCPSA
ncbi:hypothetical protein PHYPSEUDO_002795 [Phytophthora pseudosyringae]|uniref:Uncharacterized protein n=1 Tax=Phytophthora pseudosyringae TaxID=221518 RepID=A0A8T1V1M5_9STRA|nr:hypothetical protein PHYPSEUDO_002795 [Phytophthora pseudosyringae]